MRYLLIDFGATYIKCALYESGIITPTTNYESPFQKAAQIQRSKLLQTLDGVVADHPQVDAIVICTIKGEILSTLGAGDVFHGAILAALFKGEPLASALKIANIVAGLSCRGLDGTSAIPSSAELQTYLENGLK